MKSKILTIHFENIWVYKVSTQGKLISSPDAIASIESKVVYLCNGKWRLKCKELVDVRVEKNSLFLKTNDLKVELQNCLENIKHFDEFVSVCRSVKESIESNHELSLMESGTISSLRIKTNGDLKKGRTSNTLSKFSTPTKPQFIRRGIFGKVGRSTKSKLSNFSWELDDEDNIEKRKSDSTPELANEPKVDDLSPTRVRGMIAKSNVEVPGEIDLIDEEVLSNSGKISLKELSKRKDPVSVRNSYNSISKYRRIKLLRVDNDDSESDSSFFENPVEQKNTANIITDEMDDANPEHDALGRVISTSHRPTKLRLKVPLDLEETDDEVSVDVIDKADSTEHLISRVVSPSASGLTPTTAIASSNKVFPKTVSIGHPNISTFFHSKRTTLKKGLSGKSLESKIIHSKPLLLPTTPPRSPKPLFPSKSLQVTDTKRPLKVQDEWLSRSPALIDTNEKRRMEDLFGKRQLSPVHHHPVSLVEDIRETYNDSNSKQQSPIALHLTLKRPRLSNFSAINHNEHLKPDSPVKANLSSTSLNRKISLPDATNQLFPGLLNLGNTCYLNASLQMLLSCTGLFSSLQLFKGPLTRQILELYEELLRKYDTDISTKQNILSTAISPRALKRTLDQKTDKYTGYEQRDAHEFLTDLIDHIHEEVKEENLSNNLKTSLPTDDFCLCVQVSLKCTSCGYSREKEEMYRSLSIDVVDVSNIEQDSSGKPSIEKGLEHFFHPETREIKCEKCDNGSHALQTLKIISRPKFLLLHLKRFLIETKYSDVNSKENQTPNKPPDIVSAEYVLRKNKAPVIVPESLSLNKFMNLKDSNSVANGTVSEPMEANEYNLTSVVHHIGSTAHSGHYTADARRFIQYLSPFHENQENCPKTKDNSENEPTIQGYSPDTKHPSIDAESLWISYDDAYSIRTNINRITQSQYKQETAYMVLYSL